MLIRQDSNLFLQLQNFVSQSLTVTVDDNGNALSLQERQLVHTLLQASRFVYFLDHQEHMMAYGHRAVRLSTLKGRLQQVVCSTRLLLARLSDNAIRAFLNQNSRMRSLHSPRSSPALKRVVLSVALRRMVTVLDEITLEM
ncbi:hypothetical protein ElyMa_002061100 [Elysia marginata]|uniref:Uncharacterized protein n=1 Tax=Elysia marginata TaxID=1093978 RepID=A0AAV4F9B1_9GAST|nr:hypothetical protein ElyMa_002061100 [Elysia marginata]